MPVMALSALRMGGGRMLCGLGGLVAILRGAHTTPRVPSPQRHGRRRRVPQHGARGLPTSLGRSLLACLPGGGWGARAAAAARRTQTARSGGQRG